MSDSSGGAAGLDVGIFSGLVEPASHVRRQVPAQPPTLEERVFSALADAKIWTSRVAMHLNLAARDRYFRQLDLLHDCEEWLGDDQPVRLDSYKGFIRFMLMIDGDSKPSLALAPNGQLLAVWETDGGRLTIEFKSEKDVEWVVSRREGDTIERVAGTTTLGRVKANLAPYDPEAWFNVG
jgi:hypothetical protein